MKRETIAWLLFGIVVIWANNIGADPSVTSKSWPKQLPASEYGTSNYYGNGQAESFHKAMHGGTTVTSEEEREINTMLPEREDDRYYLKLGVHKSTSKLESIKNKSTDAAFTGGILSTVKANKNVTGGQVGAGYIFDKFRIDVDYIFGSDINYDQAPIFTTIPGALTSKVTGQHLIANGYYEFKDMYLIKPFIGASAGLGMNKASSTFTQTGIAGSDGVTKTKSTIGIDFGLQFGVRVKLLNSKFYASASYRYLNLGKVKWVDNSNTILLEGKRTLSGLFLDLIYLL